MQGYLVVPFLFKMLLKTSDPLSECVNVFVEHRDGHRTFIWLCMDTAAGPGDGKPIKSATTLENLPIIAHVIHIIC